MNLLERVRTTIEEHRLLSKGDTVIVAVSGGADSTALLHLLGALRNEWSLDLVVAHLDHRIRPDSAADAQFVHSVAGQLGVEAVIDAVDVRGLARRRKLSLEEAGREARYQFFSRLARERAARRIGTAHTQDDDVETVLMRLLRGDLWDALTGIPIMRSLDRVQVVRPLLRVARGDVRRYLSARSLEWREDPSNRDLRFIRNWIRLRVLADLERQIPEVRALLVSLSETWRSADRLLADLTHVHASSIADSGAQVTRIPLHEFRRHPVPVQRRMLRWAASQILGGPVSLPAVMEDRARHIATKGRAGDSADLGAIVVRVNYDVLEIARPQPWRPVAEYRLTIPGTVRAEEFGMTLTATLVDVAPTRSAGKELDEVYLDAEVLSGELRIRPWRPGDSMVPLGMRGKKKVQDIFVDDKVPRWERHRIPVVTDRDGHIVWIVGRRLSETARLSEHTRRAVRLTAHPAGRGRFGSEASSSETPPATAESSGAGAIGPARNTPDDSRVGSVAKGRRSAYGKANS